MKWLKNWLEKQNNKSQLKEANNKIETHNLISSIYYDTDWWQRAYAIEWWEKDGHFNDEQYRRVLWAKLERNQNQK
jgi:hypothetical protein